MNKIKSQPTYPISVQPVMPIQQLIVFDHINVEHQFIQIIQ